MQAFVSLVVFGGLTTNTKYVWVWHPSGESSSVLFFFFLNYVLYDFFLAMSTGHHYSCMPCVGLLHLPSQEVTLSSLRIYLSYVQGPRNQPTTEMCGVKLQ